MATQYERQHRKRVLRATGLLSGRRYLLLYSCKVMLLQCQVRQKYDSGIRRGEPEIARLPEWSPGKHCGKGVSSCRALCACVRFPRCRSALRFAYLLQVISRARLFPLSVDIAPASHNYLFDLDITSRYCMVL
jgi:hypothetical protein